MTDKKILACPFCGSEEVNIYRTNVNACWVECANIDCGAQTDSSPERDSAIGTWNTRHNVTGIYATIVEDDDKDFIP